jgi:hypothetical protein
MLPSRVYCSNFVTNVAASLNLPPSRSIISIVPEHPPHTFHHTSSPRVLLMPCLILLNLAIVVVVWGYDRALAATVDTLVLVFPEV